MTGLQLADELRKIRPDLPVILMTGYSTSLTPRGIEAAGIREVLRKPATLQSLAKAVHAALSLDLPAAVVADRPA
jgi:DNA-binding NtrC family response regulator